MTKRHKFVLLKVDIFKVFDIVNESEHPYACRKHSIWYYLGLKPESNMFFRTTKHRLIDKTYYENGNIYGEIHVSFRDPIDAVQFKLQFLCD